MKNTGPHVFDLPKRVVIGGDILHTLPNIIDDLHLGRRVFIVTGPNIRKIVGEGVANSLSNKNYLVELGTVRSTHIDEVEKIKDEVTAFKPTLIIGLGGGKSIDTAKYISSKTGIPFISVPTAASHDGIASPFASIRGIGRVTSAKASPPVAIIADIKVIAKAPHRLLLAGAGDLIGKLTAVLDWRLAHKLKGDYYGDYAASLSLLSAKHVLSFSKMISAGGLDAIRIVIEGLISASVAMCIAGSTRPASGSEHLFSHALDVVANYPALHGEQVAVGTIMMSYLHGRNWRKIRRIVKNLGLPTTAKELGVKDVDVVKALTMAHAIRPERYTILGESGLTWEAAEKLAKITGVIN
ncbi:MAG: NAD(P)-dependent glycerol-1-phosphate dehydrogenase [Desulfurococcales archaeon]|nr:NAD(P)-dependent glycerol-1-phosphate dehydrogenase [Desulfurococcales archaeon]